MNRKINLQNFAVFPCKFDDKLLRKAAKKYRNPILFNFPQQKDA